MPDPNQVLKANKRTKTCSQYHLIVYKFDETEADSEPPEVPMPQFEKHCSIIDQTLT